MGTLVINLTMGFRHCATLFLVLYAACLLMVCSQANAISGNDTDRLALLQLKAKITMDPHGVMASWNDSTHFCSWFGVTCGKRHPRVTQLNLASLELGGSISPHIGNLSFLRVIDMSYNALSDQIPQEVGYLRRLKTLILYNNKLSGQIPTELGKLSKLEFFDLFNNSLIGEIPSSLGNLSSLQKLNIAYNNLAGSIPETLGRLKQLTIMIIGKNQLSGGVPPSIFNISSLINLQICWNHLQGHLPSDLFITLPNLQVLYVDVNQFTGFIPSSLSNASNLADLDLDSNFFVGKVPDLQNLKALNSLYMFNNSLGTRAPGDLDFLCSLTNAIDLQTLSIGMNEFGGSLPECIGNLSSKLKDFRLYNNHISGNIPAGIANLVSLTYFDTSDNKLSGKVPSLHKLKALNYLSVYNNSLGTRGPGDLDFLCTLANATDLQTLVISNNEFGGSIPECINALVSLTYLDASYNKLSGQIPETLDLQNLKALNYLNIFNNSLGTRAPGDLDFLCSLTNAIDLQILYIGMNEFGGSLPECIGNLSSKLTDFRLYNNHIFGGIPAGIANLVSLTYLDVSNNKLLGKVPSLHKLKALNYLNVYNNSLGTRGPGDLDFLCTLANATDLQTLVISNNEFGGSIPECINALVSLTLLDASNNKLSGTIPVGIANLVGLEILKVHSNNISGIIPKSLGNLSNLIQIDMARNNLQGTIPASLGNCKKLQILIVSSNMLSGPIPPQLFSPSLLLFDVQSNNISGRIPVSLCNSTKLKHLILSYNQLMGSIPECLIAMTHTLVVLDITGNNLNGNIPDAFGKGCQLQSLELSRNLLQGLIPRSISNCKELKVLNVGNNQLNGTFPCELNNLSMLQVVILRSNKFSGSIHCPGKHSFWPLMQILDLGYNNFSGEIPTQLILKWRLMVVGTKEPQSNLDYLHYYLKVLGWIYTDILKLTFKGGNFEMDKVFKIFTMIDLSNNAFHGEIPKELGNLKALIVLDLSHNALVGNIPSSFGNLSAIESLDLSCNALSGRIPPEFANLNFLEYLNVSFNKLVGQIPTSTQLQSFNASAYEGNPGLYGPPLTPISIPRPPLPPAYVDDELQQSSESKMEWMLQGAEVGFPVGLALFVLPLLYIKKWRRWYCMHLGRFIMKIIGWEDPAMTRRRRRRRRSRQQRGH